MSTDGGPVVIPFATRHADVAIRRQVLVSVRAGVLAAVRPVSAPEAPGLPDALVNELIGTPVDAVRDGEYEAVIRVD